jgi:hypothetical protein
MMTDPLNIGLLAFGTLLAFLRIDGWKSQSYQAFAHLFVGGLFGAWLVLHQSFWLTLALSLCGVELGMFIVGLRGKTAA